MSIIKSFRDLIVYQKSLDLAVELFDISRNFPLEEKYSLTDQMRRSLRSIAVNIAEVWAKKIYLRAFVSKLCDALGEEYETEVWLDFAKEHRYIEESAYKNLLERYNEVRKMLVSMIHNPNTFIKNE